MLVKSVTLKVMYRKTGSCPAAQLFFQCHLFYLADFEQMSINTRVWGGKSHCLKCSFELRIMVFLFSMVLLLFPYHLLFVFPV